MPADVYDALHEPDVGQARIAAIGRARALVGGHLVEIHPDVAQLVGGGKHLGPDGATQGLVAGIGADVVYVPRTNGGDHAVFAQRHLGVQVGPFAAMAPRQHALGAGLHPLDRRAAGLARRQAGQGQVGVVVDLVAKSAAYVVSAQANLIHADPQGRRHEGQGHRHNGVGEQVDLVALIPGGDAGAGLQRGAAEAMEKQLVYLDHMGGLREGLLHRAVFIHPLEGRVRAGLVVDDDLVLKGLRGVKHRGQGFVLHLHQLRGVLGDGGGFRHHRRHRIP